MLLAHEIYGNGPNGVVVLHDFYGCKDTWSFARNFFNVKDFTYAFTEVRGYGGSRGYAGEYTPIEVASDVLALADNLGWKRFHIMGHSMSGMLAQRVVLDGQERIISAVLNTPVAASGLSFSPEGFALIEESVHEDAALAEAFDALTGNRLCREWVDFKIRQTRSNRLLNAQATYFKNCTEMGFLEEVKGNITPMLVIIGEHDMEPFTVVTAQETFLNWYPNAQIEICQNAAHYPQQETPVYFATVFNKFLKKQMD